MQRYRAAALLCCVWYEEPGMLAQDRIKLASLEMETCHSGKILYYKNTSHTIIKYR